MIDLKIVIMFWQRKDSALEDAYVMRIHRIMFFAASLAGKTKTDVVRALRDDIGIQIQNVPDPENRMWSDSAIGDLTVSFSLDFNNPHLVSQIVIAGHGIVDNLLVCANCLEMGKPRSVNFGVSLLNMRPTPRLAKDVVEKLMQHPDLEPESLGTEIILLQRNRKL